MRAYSDPQVPCKNPEPVAWTCSPSIGEVDKGFPGLVGHTVQPSLGMLSSVRDPVQKDMVDSYRERNSTSSFVICKHAHMCTHI